MPNPGDLVPYGDDAIVRRQDDTNRRLREQGAARSLAASQIGSGGLLINGGGSLTISGTGSLNVGSGALNSAGSISAGTTISAGGNISGGGFSTAGSITGNTVSTNGLSTGSATVTGDINLGGDLYTPHGLATPVTSGYFAAYINGDGRLGRTVSARRYKQDITAWAPEKQAVFALQLVTYRLKSNVLSMGDGAPVEVGLIAEELVALGLSWLVLYIDGEVEGIAYEKISLALLPVVQDHETRMLEQEAATASLSARLAALEAA